MQTGLSTITKDENSKKTSFTQTESEKELETIPALPFGIEFNKAVAKVVCGDLFAGLLTCSGEVFTWGWNIFG